VHLFNHILAICKLDALLTDRSNIAFICTVYRLSSTCTISVAKVKHTDLQPDCYHFKSARIKLTDCRPNNTKTYTAYIIMTIARRLVRIHDVVGDAHRALRLILIVSPSPCTEVTALFECRHEIFRVGMMCTLVVAFRFVLGGGDALALET
jgi:hypothetical protein